MIQPQPLVNYERRGVRTTEIMVPSIMADVPRLWSEEVHFQSLRGDTGWRYLKLTPPVV